MREFLVNYGCRKKWNWSSAVLLAGLAGVGWPAALQATTYDVGVGQPYPTIASVPRQAPGDIVNIHCGTYNEVRRWMGSGTAASPITLRGVCSTARPVIDATGHDVTGNGSAPRAVWQIEGSFYIIENLEFKNARNGDNGAGIRVMNTSVTIHNCKITRCDMGLMTSTSYATHLLVENSEIAFNGTGYLDGQSHNVYLTAGDNITFQFCYIHDSVSGENFKSRAHYTQLLYNFIANGAESEVEGLDGGSTGTANSNMTMIGNILVSTPNRTVNTTKFINFGQDVGGLHNGTLYLINNTLIAGSPSIGFLRSSASDSAIVSVNNIFFGSDTIVQPGWGNRISGHNNWLPSAATIPLGFTSTIAGTDPKFLNAAQQDYHLTSASPALGIGLVSPLFFDGAGVPHSAIPAFEYVKNLGSRVRPASGLLDAGAYEYASASSVMRVRSGSTLPYTDPQGNTWSADYGYSGGSTYSTSAPIAGTTTPVLYQHERWQSGNFTYTFAVPAGAHTVTLKFAENYFTQPGQRIFNVSINGQTVLSNFDIVREAGGAHMALDKSFPVNVANGSVTIQFSPGTANNPKINAIEIQ